MFDGWEEKEEEKEDEEASAMTTFYDTRINHTFYLSHLSILLKNYRFYQFYQIKICIVRGHCERLKD